MAALPFEYTQRQRAIQTTRDDARRIASLEQHDRELEDHLALVASRLLVMVNIHADAGANWTLTNSPASFRFAGNAIGRVAVALPGQFSACRFFTNVVTVGAAGGIVRLVSHSAWSTTFATWSDVAGTDLSLAATGPQDSGWQSLDPSHSFIAVAEGGGDGATDPALGATYIALR